MKKPEEVLKEALELTEQIPDDERILFFHLIAAASIAYIRGAQGEEVLAGFLYAAQKDTITMTYEGFKSNLN